MTKQERINFIVECYNEVKYILILTFGSHAFPWFAGRHGQYSVIQRNDARPNCSHNIQMKLNNSLTVTIWPNIISINIYFDKLSPWYCIHQNGRGDIWLLMTNVSGILYL